MIPYLGKREAGGLTAASPGDTLYFPFEAYNDSGDSEALSGLAVTDIEVFKNGVAVARATDSGYSLISDTGQVGDRVGLYRCSVQLFNTSDDTGFFDAGGHYMAAVDAVTIDGKTVRFWLGTWEIGRQKVNVEEIDGDTGPADNLGRIAGDTGTGSYLYLHRDTGGIADAIWAKDSRTLTSFAFDTGVSHTVWNAAARTLTSFAFDTGVWGSNFASGRTLTSFGFDTGVAQTVWRQSTSSFTSDTGSVAYAQGRVMAVRNDTGAAHLDQGRFGVISDSGRQAAVLDTGKVASAIWASHQTRTLTAFQFDTGIWGSNFASGRTLTSFSFDTGIRDTIWRASPSSYTADTGSAAYALGRLMAVKGDTGAAHLDQGRLGVIADSGVLAAVLDTGKVASAVWSSHATRTLTSFGFDTGVSHTVWNAASRTLTAFQFDTGIWGSNFASGRTLTAFGFDTGIAQTVWREQNSAYTDTGSFGYGVNVHKLDNDTGAVAHVAQAFAAQNTNSDTGLVANAAAIRVQTDKIQFDTGANEIHADIRKVNNVQVQGAGDTGTGNTWRPV